ncbi:PB1-F2 protein [Influenza A virus (A/chicken/Coahuila/1433-15/2006(H5N2))]|uniref:Protein PB1-F2 n=1 Tax=Influenza A virus (A/chicken/Coahuila/1433-15/2006(H5N2)) TaxID=1541671 RepID=A0A089WUN0_9INFA|nr:PB1-F2 protein [Influenza A virus (A/chicken/Coahuila/1433-15/2006(H5N2))]
MEREQDTPWTQSIGPINIQKRGGGQQTQRPEHPNSIRLMGHCPWTMSQVDMHKQTVSSKQWLSLKSPTQESLKTRVLKRWKLSNKQEWIN